MECSRFTFVSTRTKYLFYVCSPINDGLYLWKMLNKRRWLGFLNVFFFFLFFLEKYEGMKFERRLKFVGQGDHQRRFNLKNIQFKGF